MAKQPRQTTNTWRDCEGTEYHPGDTVAISTSADLVIGEVETIYTTLSSGKPIAVFDPDAGKTKPSVHVEVRVHSRHNQYGSSRGSKHVFIFELANRIVKLRSRHVTRDEMTRAAKSITALLDELD